MSSSSSPPPSKEEVDALLSNPSSFGPSIIPQLEAYVLGEATGAVPYHLDVNRNLLKLYQFFPTPPSSANDADAADGNNNSENNTSDSTNSNSNNVMSEMTALVLLLALLEYPNTDLLVVSSLVSERLQQQHMSTILQCAELLDACQFVEFWTTFATLAPEPSSDANVAVVTKALETLIKNTATLRLQTAIVQVLASTYRSAPLALVQSALGGDGSTAEKFASTIDFASTIESVSGNLVTFVATPDNTKRNRVFKEEVDFSAISKMMILSRE